MVFFCILTECFRYSKSLNPQQLFLTLVCLFTALKKMKMGDLNSANTYLCTGKKNNVKINVCHSAAMSYTQIVGGWGKIGEPSPCLSPRYQGYDTCQHTP